MRFCYFPTCCRLFAYFPNVSIISSPPRIRITRARSAITMASNRLDGGLDGVVHHHVFVARELADLGAGGLEPAPDLLVAVLAPAAQPLLEDGR